MNLQIHLLSLPWGVKHIPSIQIGSLKAYILRHRPELSVSAHHLHLSIPSEVFSEERYWSSVAKNFHESYYLYLLSRRFGHRFSLPEPQVLYEEMRVHAESGRKGFEFLSEEDLAELGRVTDQHLEEFVVKPGLEASKLLIGMTTNFLQTYANVYACAYLEEKLKGKDITFVLGGSSVSYPQVVSTLSRLNLKAHIIVGEGEKKLLEFIQHFEQNAPLEDKASGVFSLESVVDLTVWNDDWHRSQVKSFSELPDPDYREYFDILNQRFTTKDWAQMVKKVELPLEGSRGCVFSCEFCNLNRFWEGYRKRPGEEIARRALKITKQYGAHRVRFVDNLCDGWAKDYAEELIREGATLSSMMEMRPKHDENFWEVLRASGLHECQIGVEGLDEDILRRVKKGTTVMDIVFSQKILTEKLISRGSRQLITFYPKSTAGEVLKTREMLELLLHMPRFDIGGFALGVDSPLYRELSKDTQQGLHVSSSYTSAMPRWREELSVHFYLENPPELAPTSEATSAWRELVDWYHGVTPDHWVRNFLIVSGNRIRDARSGQEKTLSLEDHATLVYENCHAPVTVELLMEKTSLAEELIRKILGDLSREKLLLEKNKQYIALALRISDEKLLELQNRKFHNIAR